VTDTRSRIERNLERVRGRISAAAERAGRDPASVRLVAVTKTVGVEEARILVELGVTDLGENRIEGAREKISAVGSGARWHMIGSVQRRKARDVAGLFDTVDSVDRVEVGEALAQRCEEQGRELDVLLEVNVSGEPSKHGFDPENVADAVRQMAQWGSLHVRGVMTMAPFVEDAEAVRPVFARLRRLAGELGLAEVSMGMTNDFEVAVEEGATQVRIGTALFE
jgi:pyridoxal phosphate enzyme (YggS family)